VKEGRRNRRRRQDPKMQSERPRAPGLPRRSPSEAKWPAFPFQDAPGTSQDPDYRGRLHTRLHSLRAERMKVKPPSPPRAQSVVRSWARLASPWLFCRGYSRDAGTMGLGRRQEGRRTSSARRQGGRGGVLRPFSSRAALRERAEALAANEGPSVQYAFFGTLDEASAGYRDRPRRLAAQNSNGRDQSFRASAALILAETGDVGRAQKLVDALDRDSPLGTVLQDFYLPTIRAAMKLHVNDPARALDILQPTATHELMPADAFNMLWPAYVRGLAYLQIGEGARRSDAS
jgi:hypothetical protein